jgi:hypothetical protein
MISREISYFKSFLSFAKEKHGKFNGIKEMVSNCGYLRLIIIKSVDESNKKDRTDDIFFIINV